MAVKLKNGVIDIDKIQIDNAILAEYLAGLPESRREEAIIKAIGIGVLAVDAETGAWYAMFANSGFQDFGEVSQYRHDDSLFGLCRCGRFGHQCSQPLQFFFIGRQDFGSRILNKLAVQPDASQHHTIDVFCIADVFEWVGV